eukprot:3361462-Rhodomonas_salina.1
MVPDWYLKRAGWHNWCPQPALTRTRRRSDPASIDVQKRSESGPAHRMASRAGRPKGRLNCEL